MSQSGVRPALWPAVIALATLAFGVSAAPASAVTAAVAAGQGAKGSWGKAQEVPGTGKVNTGGDAAVQSLSCASPGNCLAGGWYGTKTGEVAFLAAQHGGHWGTAFKVPGSLVGSKDAEVDAVSCPASGDCAAAGFYQNSILNEQAFVVSERNGHWSAAKEVPGSGSLNAGNDGGISELDCLSAGNCVATGYYTDSSHHDHVYTVSERNGSWGQASQVPGMTALGVGSYVLIDALSCPSIGGCVLGGQYLDSHEADADEAFLAVEKNGHWQAAKQVPGTNELNASGTASTSAVSCASVGNCSASGSYEDESGFFQVFVISEQNGRWGTAVELAGSAKLNAGGRAEVGAESCRSAGDCVIGGEYGDSQHHEQAFIATEKGGHWSPAQQVPGTGKLNQAGGALVIAVSCSSAGNCGIGGSYAQSKTREEAFVDNEVNGRWKVAVEVPGSGTLNGGGIANITAISCRSSVACTAGGSYQDGRHRQQALVVSETG
jgi:hypothetical protein